MHSQNGRSLDIGLLQKCAEIETSSSGVSGFGGSAGLSAALASPLAAAAFGSTFAFGSALGSVFGVAGAAGDGAFDDLVEAAFFFCSNQKIKRKKTNSNKYGSSFQMNNEQNTHKLEKSNLVSAKRPSIKAFSDCTQLVMFI